jgi:hypothetical protein
MDYSRDRKCDDNQGGNVSIYLLPYVKYLQSQIIVSKNILTTFPSSTIFDMNADNINFNISVKEDRDIVFEEKVSFQLKKLNEIDKFKEIVGRDWRVIVKANNVKIRMFGLRNGMIGSYNEDSGRNRTDFNGYAFNFDNKESESAPYLNDLSGFVIRPISGLFISDGQGNIIQDGNDNLIIT